MARSTRPKRGFSFVGGALEYREHSEPTYVHRVSDMIDVLIDDKNSVSGFTLRKMPHVARRISEMGGFCGDQSKVRNILYAADGGATLDWRFHEAARKYGGLRLAV